MPILTSVEFVLFTQPKTGTHLLIPILSELTSKKISYSPRNDLIPTPWNSEIFSRTLERTRISRAFLHTHPYYSHELESCLAENKHVNFFVKRDPRDIIVSLLNHYKYINFNDKFVEQITTDDERLLYMISYMLRNLTLGYMGWLNSPVCCVLDFNMLMGSHGGAATDADALIELRKIAYALRLDLPDSYLVNVYKKHFGSGYSFFKGKTSSWKNYFNSEHVAATKEVIGDLLVELGYEKDLNW